MGVTIEGGGGGEGTFSPFVPGGSPAYLGGELGRGEQSLAVNEVDLTRSSHDEAAGALKGAGRDVAMRVQYRPEEYNRYEYDDMDDMYDGGSKAKLTAVKVKNICICFGFCFVFCNTRALLSSRHRK